MKRKVKTFFVLSVAFLILFCSLFALFDLLHEIANEQRSHNGVGGEIAVWFIPIVAYFFYKNVKDTKSVFCKDKKDDHT